jgi:hypothetical protein
VPQTADVSKINIRSYFEMVIKKPIPGISAKIIAVGKIKVVNNAQVKTRVLRLRMN